MEGVRVIRPEDFRGVLSVGLSGAPEVAAAVAEIATGAERRFYALLLGVTEAGRFYEDLEGGDAEAEAFAEASRPAVTRYAYCQVVEDSRDSLHALNGVFITDSATGEPVAANRRLASAWNAMCAMVDGLRPRLDVYRRRLRSELGLNPSCRRLDPFRVTNTLFV